MEQESSILSKLDSVVPAPLADFDAFPKLPSTYKARSESRGFMTLFVCFMAFVLMLNDIGEYIWGWPNYTFDVDPETSSYMSVNVDLVVNMPCKYLSVDLRDAVGDRLFLSGGLTRDGTLFDIGQATSLKEHTEMLSAQQVVTQSRRSRGLFDTILRRKRNGFRPTYHYQSDASACRIYGSLDVKKVTANLHITTLGHGYASYEHVDHNLMNLSHIITEFSFGPFFPDITQPLDYSYELADKHFVAYQYFLHVVPTTYIAPRSYPLYTNQYSVTHYVRELEHDRGTPGIFFKFDLDPLTITIHQKTTTFVQLLIRCVGVIGGVFVCMGYAIRITYRAVEVVTGADQAPGIVAAEASGVKVGLRAKWSGQQLRARRPESGSPYTSYTNTPRTGTFTPYQQYSSAAPSFPGSGIPGSPVPGSGVGLGLPSSAYNLPPSSPMRPPPPRTPSSGYAPPPAVLRTPSGLSGSGSLHGNGTPGTPTLPQSPNPMNGNGHGLPQSQPNTPRVPSLKKND